MRTSGDNVKTERNVSAKGNVGAESPDNLQMSLAAAMTLGLRPGRFYRERQTSLHQPALDLQGRLRRQVALTAGCSARDRVNSAIRASSASSGLSSPWN